MKIGNGSVLNYSTVIRIRSLQEISSSQYKYTKYRVRIKVKHIGPRKYTGEKEFLVFLRCRDRSGTDFSVVCFRNQWLEHRKILNKARRDKTSLIMILQPPLSGRPAYSYWGEPLSPQKRVESEVEQDASLVEGHPAPNQAGNGK